MSTLKVNTIQNTSGVEVFTCKAWVNFDGTFGTSPFTVANGGIRAAGNVSSVTDNGTGSYIINFVSGTFTDADYATIATSFAESTGWGSMTVKYGTTPTASGINLSAIGYANYYDPLIVTVAFFR